LTKTETAKIMAVLQGNYPRYYAGMDLETKRQAANLWADMLGEYPYELVMRATEAVIAANKFPPTVAEVIEKINAIKNGPGMTELEAWGYVSRAVRSSAYHAREEWEKLPEDLRRIVSPDLLRSWAMVEADNAETVLQSNFLRTFREAQARRKAYDALPGSVKAYMARIGGNADGLLPVPGQGDRELDGEAERAPV